MNCERNVNAVSFVQFLVVNVLLWHCFFYGIFCSVVFYGGSCCVTWMLILECPCTRQNIRWLFLEGERESCRFLGGFFPRQLPTNLANVVLNLREGVLVFLLI